jgi:hypothetical protein
LQQHDAKAAEEDLHIVLKNPNLHVLQVSQALLTLRRIQPSAISGLRDFPAYRELPAESKATILLELAKQPGCLPNVVPFIEEVLPSLSGQTGLDLRFQLALHAISQRQFDAAMQLLGERPTESSAIHDCFNYAMAEWGKMGIPPIDLFKYVVLGHEATKARRSDPNYLQCVGLSYAMVGDLEKAKQQLTIAQHRALVTARPIFSCWTYSVVERDDFLTHVDEMQARMVESNLHPPVLK